MSSIVIAGDTSGSITLAAPAVAGTNTLTLPANTGTIITTASNGQVIPKAALPTGSVLQVVSTTKTDTFSSASTSYVDITGLNVTITPTSSASKILVMYTVNGKSQSTPSMRLTRNGTAICIADASASLQQSTAGTFQGGPDNNQTVQVAGHFLDSPATTSATTYQVQVITDGGTTYYNRSPNDYYSRYTSTITVMEIAA